MLHEILENIADELVGHINNCNVDDTRNTFLHGISINQRVFINIIKSKGIFRPSNYNFEVKTINETLKMIINSKEHKLHEEVTDYINSIISINHIAHSLRSKYKEYQRKGYHRKLKTFFATIDYLFWYDSPLLEDQDVGNMLNHFTKEDCCEAFSYFFQTYCADKNLKEVYLNTLDEDAINRKSSLKEILELCKFIKFRHCEILIDCFGFLAYRIKSKVYIFNKDEQFRKCMNLGFIRTNMQFLNDQYNYIQESDNSSINRLIDQSREVWDRLFEIVDYPVERIICKVPLIEPLLELINSKMLFKEESFGLVSLSKEMLINGEQISFNKIYKDLTIFDILKLQRFYTILYNAYKQYIEYNDLVGDNIFYRSFLPVTKREDLVTIWTDLFGREKATQLFSLLSYNPDIDVYLDIQYTPLICIKEYVVVPLGIISKSNLYRNILLKARYRFDKDKKNDPIGDRIEECISKKTKMFFRDIEYSFNNIKGELDFMAICGKNIFVFECKNSLHPCNPYELRNSWQYIQKGAQQLDQFAELFENKKFKDYFSQKINHNLDGYELITCIVVGNRMFNGWKQGKHPVRNIHELYNIIDEGIITLTRSSRGQTQKETYRVWKDEEFTHSDLAFYIRNDPIHKIRFDSLVQYNDIVNINGKELILISYALDSEQVVEEIMKQYTQV